MTRYKELDADAVASSPRRLTAIDWSDIAICSRKITREQKYDWWV